MKAGIDFGSSMTDLVILDKDIKKFSFVNDKSNVRIIKKILDNHKVKNINITGAYAKPLAGFKIKKVDEIKAIGKGGLYVSGFKNALVVSVGSGTAMVSCSKGFKHIGGTAIGGKTLEGLSKLLWGFDNLIRLEELAEKGNISKVDLMIKDIYPKGIGLLGEGASASHFGKLKGYRKADIALGLINMAAQSIGTLAVFGAKAYGHKNIVLTGGLTRLKVFRDVISKRVNVLSDIPITIPKNSSVATAIGSCLI